MNNLNRKKITVALSMLLILVAVFGTFTYMNKAKASGNVVIDGITWGFDINENNEAVNLYAPWDITTSTITIPTEVTYKNVTYPVVSVGKTNVSNESSLFFGSLEPNTTVSFAQKDGKTSITKINAYAFCGCTNIQSVNIPDSVTEIGDYAFYNCGRISSFTIPYDLTKIGKGAFEKCTSATLTIENPNLAKENLVDSGITFIVGCSNSTAREYYNEYVEPDYGTSRWVSLDGTTKADGTTYPKSFKVMVKTDTDVTVASGLFKDYFYGLAGKEVSDLTECATKPYYTLDGYYLGTDDNAECYYTYDKTNDKMITKKSTFSADYADDIMELTPKFTPKSYDIVYSLNGGQWKKGVSADLENTNKEQYVYSVGKVLNTNVEKRGYLFTGWYADINNPVVLTTKVTDTEHGLKSFLAKWSPIHYDIKFDKNTADAGSMAGQNIAYDTTTALTKNGYTKKGYSFTGWNTKADGSGKTYHDEDNVLNLATNGVITLYAQWSANHYSVVFDRNHATGGVVGAVSMIYDQSRQLPANGFTRTGYQFDGWNAKADGSGQSYKDKAYVTNLATSGVTTLYAQWKPLTDTRYTVYYAYEGIPGQQNTGWFETQRHGTTDTMVKPDLSMFAKTGFITPETEELKIKPDGSSEAFYTFKRQQYTITVNDNDKKIKKWNAPKTAYYEEKVDVSFETNAGYQAAGITTDSIVLEDATQTTAHFTMPASDITLTAKADPLKYTVSYEMNHGTNSGNSVTEYTYGDTVALPDASTMSLPGFVFDGWYTKESFDGEPVTHILPDTIGNKTFWAKWVSGNYKVTLDAQGGTIKDGNVTEYTYYTGAKLPTNVVKDGYSFLGWWDGYKTATEIGNMEYGDKTYVALWADNSSTAYTYVDGDTVNLYDASQAVAMTETIDTKNTGYYYTQLSANAKKAYATLFANYRFVPEERTIRKMNALIFTSDVELSKKDLLDAQMAFVYDHPEVFWVTYFAKSDVNNVSGVNTGKHYYMYSPVMAYDVALCKGDAEAYYGYLNMALNAMDLKKSDTTYDKVKRIHDYIIKNYSYSTYGYKLNGKTADDTRSVGRMLTMKRGCCVGYSKLMKAFCDYYGISCTLVSGTDHMWNAIQINGKWYALDVTWDDADGKQKNSKEQYQYFLKGEKTFLADVSHRVVNCMFIQDKVPITEYACLTAPILEKGDYGTHTSVKKSTANTKITVRSGVKYKITNTKKKTAAVIGASSKSIKKAVIAKTVKINKKTYKVTAISKNAFKNCKKLKKVIIQQGKLSIGKNAFKGINKKAAFKVPKKNLKSYKKMLSKAKTGCKKTMKIAGWKVKK